jgi:hypothetical protein
MLDLLLKLVQENPCCFDRKTKGQTDGVALKHGFEYHHPAPIRKNPPPNLDPVTIARVDLLASLHLSSSCLMFRML